MYWTVNTQQLLHVSPNLMEVLDLNGGPLWSWFIHEQLQVSISLHRPRFLHVPQWNVMNYKKWRGYGYWSVSKKSPDALSKSCLTSIQFDVLAVSKNILHPFCLLIAVLSTTQAVVFLGKCMCLDHCKNHGCGQKKPEGTTSAIFGVGTAAKYCELSVMRPSSLHGPDNKDEVLVTWTLACNRSGFEMYC